MFIFNKKKTTTPQIILFDLLKSKGVNAILEYPDGHKSVDIAIPEAKIYIEIDGIDHFINPEQIERDFKREHYSEIDKFSTMHIPNIIVEHHTREVADGIIEVIKKTINTIEDNSFHFLI